MKGIKDIIVKGAIFAVLSTVFCVGGAGRGLETARANGHFPYRDWDNTEKVLDQECHAVDNTGYWGEPDKETWYVASNFFLAPDIDRRITVSGNVNLILCDDKSLTVPYGIHVSGENSLTIYGQLEGTGKLIVTAEENYNGAGIGGDSGETAGRITINGGYIETTGGDGGAGIGGGTFGAGGTVTINGGVVKAHGGRYAAGIGGGEGGAGGTVTINGGVIEATGGEGGAGIGGGNYGAGGTITINGGTVAAGDGGYGIGGGNGSTNYCSLTLGAAVKLYGRDDTPFDSSPSVIPGDEYIMEPNMSGYDYPYDSGHKYMKAIGPEMIAMIGNVPYNDLKAAVDAANPGDTVTLLKDVTIDDEGSMLTVDKKLTLDLNNCCILSQKEESTKAIITVRDGGDLTLTDSKGDRKRYVILNDTDIQGGSLPLGTEVVADKPNGNEGENYITVTGGCITGGFDNGVNGGAIHIDGGTFTMTGGNLCGNIESDGDGSAVRVDEGRFIMTGGRICGNHTHLTDTGGAVFVSSDGTFKMSGNAELSENHGEHGGAVNIYGGTFTMEGGSIRGNNASSGGGVYVEDGSFIMKGGSISGNEATSEGGGVYVMDGSFIMSDTALISGNNSDTGGGVYIDAGEFTLKGGKLTANSAEKCGGVYNSGGTFAMNGGAVTGNYANEKAGGVCSWSDFQLSGAAEINGNVIGATVTDGELKGGTESNVCVWEDESPISVTGKLKNKIPIGVTIRKFEDNSTVPGVFAEADGDYNEGDLTEEDAAHFKSDIEGYAPILNEAGEAELATAYKVTVNNGTGGGSYGAGGRVKIKANAPASGKRFKEWTGADALTFTSGSKTTAEATFTMPDTAVTVEATYEDMEKVKAPVFAPDGGTYTSPQNVTISSETPEAVIYYTVDGSAPTKSSTKYTGPVSVAETTTIKAIAVKEGMLDSEVSSATYTISSEPSVTTYAVTVENGTGDGDYAAGVTVTITSDAPADGQVFNRWTGDGVTFADETSSETTFMMPGHDVTVSATYKDKGEKEDDPDPNPDHDPAPNPDPNPDPGKPEQEKMPEKVLVSDPASSYASTEDNFAPVAPGSSEGTGGSIKKLELDFSKVKGSGVATDSLKMTAIAGSKFTTKEKVKDKNSVTTEGGVKAKFNKKDSTVTIACKSTGKATFNMEDGDSYTVNFTVDKPKPNKNEAKLSTGTAPVTKTIKDLFGTSINGGKLTIVKEKVSGQATLKGNELTVNPAEKDTIKLQYQYLNKKYKLNIKVK